MSDAVGVPFVGYRHRRAVAVAADVSAAVAAATATPHATPLRLY